MYRLGKSSEEIARLKQAIADQKVLDVRDAEVEKERLKQVEKIRKSTLTIAQRKAEAEVKRVEAKAIKDAKLILKANNIRDCTFRSHTSF